jgi:hypothetical protein
MPGRHLPADHSKGDANTIGGYMAVHARPAAFEGSDGYSYSVELATDTTGDAERPVGAFLLFLRWRRIGEQGVEGHLESDFLAFGLTPAAAREALGAMPLSEVKSHLDALIAARHGAPPARKWWDVMREEGEGGGDEEDRE